MDKAVCVKLTEKKIQYNQNKELDTRYPSRHQQCLGDYSGGQVHIYSCFEKK